MSASLLHDHGSDRGLGDADRDDRKSTLINLLTEVFLLVLLCDAPFCEACMSAA